jgi:ATP-dependent DNA ligase
MQFLEARVSESLPSCKPQWLALDGEIVALDKSGRPSFNALQNGAPAA